MSQIIEMHRSYLPHYQEAGKIISLTWRLAFTLPNHLQKLLIELKDINQIAHSTATNIDTSKNNKFSEYSKKIQEWDDYLGEYSISEMNLSEPKTANIICTAFKFYDNNLYTLHSYCIMPNHIHLLLEPREYKDNNYYKISDIVKRLKAYTAKEINKLDKNNGCVWSKDYFDRYIRNEKDYGYSIMYILNNPVKAKLVHNYADWQYSYYNDKLIKM